MKRDWKMELYWRLPRFLQETVLSFYAGYLEALYYGRGYEEWRQVFEERQTRSAQAFACWQDERLRGILEIAATRVPFYRGRWQGIDWRSIRSASDLRCLPFLDKHSLRQHEGAFIAEGVHRSSLWVEKTSGTTGTALRIYWPKTMLPQWWALVEVAIRNVAGVGQEIPRAMIGGRTVVHGTANKPPYWRYNCRWRQLYLSAYHISRTTAADYVNALRHHGSEWMTGYGSAIAALAQCALEAGIPPVPMRAVIVSGDTLLPGMRTSIEEFFRCKCYDSYGQCEGVSMAMECPEGMLHIIPAAGVWEIVRGDGSPCEPGEVGEIVATGILNTAMPLIRYRTGDRAAWAERQNCSCGNEQPIICDLEGRVDDYLITPDGKRIGRLAAFRRSSGIHSAQLVQDHEDHAFLLVRPGPAYQSRDAIALRNDILERVGTFRIDIVEVAEIPKTPAGKTALVVRLTDNPRCKALYQQLFGSSPAVKMGNAA